MRGSASRPRSFSSVSVLWVGRNELETGENLVGSTSFPKTDLIVTYGAGVCSTIKNTCPARGQMGMLPNSCHNLPSFWTLLWMTQLYGLGTVPLLHAHHARIIWVLGSSIYFGPQYSYFSSLLEWQAISDTIHSDPHPVVFLVLGTSCSCVYRLDPMTWFQWGKKDSSGDGVSLLD